MAAAGLLAGASDAAALDEDDRSALDDLRFSFSVATVCWNDDRVHAKSRQSSQCMALNMVLDEEKKKYLENLDAFRFGKDRAAAAAAASI